MHLQDRLAPAATKHLHYLCSSTLLFTQGEKRRGGKSKELCKTEDKKSFLFSWERKPPLLKGLGKMVATLATQLD